ncbi:pyrimidine 5'-nucleotidase [Paracoccus beibuensis]|uniref:pyrimidine 5'-nucleotidase n=1 Tax=Paracoccus beibuensis TaxID=547602 RepID=UPI00223F69FE|nr:pyrimidine 5'-nucleotidase [Paracoccus beibuensis]
MDFSHVRIWIFDLDNTLYPPEAQLFAQIETRMTAWMMRLLDVPQDHANRLRAEYWRLHGTTLAGLMAEHAIDPQAYLADVHDIDFSVLDPAPDLARAIAALPGRRIVHTNGDAAYARRVLAARGLENLFEAVYGIEETGFQPKPAAEAFARVIAAAGIDPRQAAFFEDDPRNLQVPHDLGMRTVLVGSGRHGPDALQGDPGPHVHHRTDDLTAFLCRIVPQPQPG